MELDKNRHERHGDESNVYLKKEATKETYSILDNFQMNCIPSLCKSQNKNETKIAINALLELLHLTLSSFLWRYQQ